VSKRRDNATAHQEGRRAFHRFAISQRVQAEIAINSATGHIGKMRQAGAAKWSSGYTENFVKGWERARSEAGDKSEPVT